MLASRPHPVVAFGHTFFHRFTTLLNPSSAVAFRGTPPVAPASAGDVRCLLTYSNIRLIMRGQSYQDAALNVVVLSPDLLWRTLVCGHLFFHRFTTLLNPSSSVAFRGTPPVAPAAPGDVGFRPPPPPIHVYTEQYHPRVWPNEWGGVHCAGWRGGNHTEGIRRGWRGWRIPRELGGVPGDTHRRTGARRRRQVTSTRAVLASVGHAKTMKSWYTLTG